MPVDPAAVDGALWVPTAEFTAQARLTDYRAWLEREHQLVFNDYRQLWTWSTTDLGAFWMSIRDYFDLDIDDPQQVLDESTGMPHARWFIGSTTNYAANALVNELEDGLAIQSLDESGALTQMTWSELRHAVGGVANWFREQGVVPGDRIVGYVPNIAGAVIAMLASAAVGAVWASCAQEYSAQGAHDRFAQLEPKILIAADGYHHGGKIFDRQKAATELAESLPTVESVVWIDNLGLLDKTSAGQRLADLTANGCEPEFSRVPFDHPLWVLFSSGTTGVPKGIVHSHGGILLEHTKFCGLHSDIGPGQRFLWLATPSWMVWNIQISGLLVGATISTYDGAPSWPDAAQIWRIAERLGLDVLGVSAASLVAAQKAGTPPQDVAPNLSVRAIGSTGSPLPPETATWVYQQLPDVWLASASGGTDICSAFAGGVPTEPVFADQIQGPALGVLLDAWNEDAKSVIGQTGEMVVTRPMPSMPLRFWNDTDFAKYTRAYFDRYPGVWRHGDWITINELGGVIIHGRSDATMNRHGVRIGSGEIYQVVDQMSEVVDSVVVGVELADGGYWMPLFVVPAQPLGDTRPLIELIRNEIRTNVSPRHVPDEIIFVDSLPHTRTGKKLEIPIKRILQGADPAAVVNPQAVDNADALYQFVDFRPRDSHPPAVRK